jgi:hypothetical protein
MNRFLKWFLGFFAPGILKLVDKPAARLLGRYEKAGRDFFRACSDTSQELAREVADTSGDMARIEALRIATRYNDAIRRGLLLGVFLGALLGALGCGAALLTTGVAVAICLAALPETWGDYRLVLGVGVGGAFWCIVVLAVIYFGLLSPSAWAKRWLNFVRSATRTAR